MAHPSRRIECTCQECGIKFSVPKAQVLKKNAGKYCSMDCRHRQSREFGWIKKTYWAAKIRCDHKEHYKDVEFKFTSYEQLANEMGPKPSSAHTIDRIDCKGHYEPGNVRWATQKEQNDNREVTIWHEGQTLFEVCQQRGLKYETAWRRIKSLGWSIEDALNRPVRRYR